MVGTKTLGLKKKSRVGKKTFEVGNHTFGSKIKKKTFGVGNKTKVIIKVMSTSKSIIGQFKEIVLDK